MPDLSSACHAVAAGISPDHLGPYLIVGAVLFALGVGVVVTRRNAVGFLMGLELILNAAALNFATYARFRPHGGELDGQVMTLFIIVLAAAEAAVALALLFAVFRTSGDIDLEQTITLASPRAPEAPRTLGEARVLGEASSSSPSGNPLGEASSSSPSGNHA